MTIPLRAAEPPWPPTLEHASSGPLDREPVVKPIQRLIAATRRIYASIQADGGAPFGAFEGGVLVVAALGMIAMQFGGSEGVFLDLFADHFIAEDHQDLVAAGAFGQRAAASYHPWYPLASLYYWAGFCVIGYVVIPSLYLKVTRQKLLDYYLQPGGFLRHAHIYLLLCAPVLVVVWIVSHFEEFQYIYPFYRHAGRSWGDLILWELGYGLQFFALEFFFRGFLLQGLRRWAGAGAIFIMVVPYCMVHFLKTASESAGSIIAGVILGLLAMHYRSIWGGVLVHWLIAIAMDLAALFQKGQLPTQWWPDL